MSASSTSLLSDVHRYELATTLLWQFREDAESVADQIGAVCDGGEPARSLIDIRETFRRLVRLSDLMDTLGVPGDWSAEESFHEEFVARALSSIDGPGARRPVAAPTIEVDDDLVPLLRAAATNLLDNACDEYTHKVTTTAILEGHGTDEEWTANEKAHAHLASAFANLEMVGARRADGNPGPLPATLVVDLATNALIGMTYPLRENDDINDKTPATGEILEAITACAGLAQRMLALSKAAADLIDDSRNTSAPTAATGCEEAVLTDLAQTIRERLPDLDVDSPLTEPLTRVADELDAAVQTITLT